MKFGAPRSISPSPVRRKPRSRSTFGLQSDSDSDYGYSSDSYSESESDSDSSRSTDSRPSSPSSDSFCYASESEVPKLPPKPKHPPRNTAEQQRIEDTVAAIRLRTRHHDPYEDWERQTRMDAFRTARKELSATQTRFHTEQDRIRAEADQRRAARHAAQMADVQRRLAGVRLAQKAEEDQLREAWKLREKDIWDRIEGVIKIEEDKVKVRLEVERKVQEEKERKLKEEEMKKRLLEEKRKQEEEKKRQDEAEAKRLEDEKKKQEQEEEQLKLMEDLLKAERLENEREHRKAIGMTTAEDDWFLARAFLQEVKSEVAKVKSNREVKSEWSKWRRQITPKIGQITDDEVHINRISTELLNIMRPPNMPAHDPHIYKALLSSLSKAILLQAETEVTAEKKSAKPLAQVAFNLLNTVPDFAEIFFAKLVQRTGGWPIPIVVPKEDIDEKPWKDEAARTKAMGYRKSSVSDDLESAAEYTTRVAGIMRVYFHILKIPPRQPLQAMFQLPRLWIWLSRLAGERGLLETAVAPQLIYTALDVMGSYARQLWGHQWNKLLELIYEGVSVGFGSGRFIGGSSPEGIAARVRVELEIERILLGA
ncbi:Nucleoporin gle1 [Hypsizygus marmoreus]|uniref:mRNA export factor GLE1 n=1 Tax=Hypsizygus marmoreus TaxID=39966 RepID=A0A369J7F4_HYPMA|nr:Nucleoporin gle1 [Hypsizygus marmoreus]